MSKISKIFRKNIEPSCAYCAHGQTMNAQQVSCCKRGVVAVSSACRKFVYDPLRRVPAKPAVIRGVFSAQDFALCEEETP